MTIFNRVLSWVIKVIIHIYGCEPILETFSRLLNRWMHFSLILLKLEDIFAFDSHHGLTQEIITWISWLKLIFFSSYMYSLFLTIIYSEIRNQVLILAISQLHFEFIFVLMLFVVSKSYSYVSMQSNSYNKKSISCTRNIFFLFLSFIY